MDRYFDVNPVLYKKKKQVRDIFLLYFKQKTMQNVLKSIDAAIFLHKMMIHPNNNKFRMIE